MGKIRILWIFCCGKLRKTGKYDQHPPASKGEVRYERGWTFHHEKNKNFRRHQTHPFPRTVASWRHHHRPLYICTAGQRSFFNFFLLWPSIWQSRYLVFRVVLVWLFLHFYIAHVSIVVSKDPFISRNLPPLDALSPVTIGNAAGPDNKARTRIL